MDKSNEETGVELFGMTSYSYHDEVFKKDRDHRIKPSKISYGDAGFRNFNLREVFIDGKPKGEYYLRIKDIKDKRTLQNAALFLTGKLQNCEIGLIDPHDILHLEYHIYIKTKDELMMEAMTSMMEHIDGYITSHSGRTTV